MNENQQRRDDHDKLFRLYQIGLRHANMLDIAGAIDKAEEIRLLCQIITRDHVLDRVLGRS